MLGPHLAVHGYWSCNFVEVTSPSNVTYLGLIFHEIWFWVSLFIFINLKSIYLFVYPINFLVNDLLFLLSLFLHCRNLLTHGLVRCCIVHQTVQFTVCTRQHLYSYSTFQHLYHKTGGHIGGLEGFPGVT